MPVLLELVVLRAPEALLLLELLGFLGPRVTEVLVLEVPGLLGLVVLLELELLEVLELAVLLGQVLLEVLELELLALLGLLVVLLELELLKVLELEVLLEPMLLWKLELALLVLLEAGACGTAGVGAATRDAGSIPSSSGGAARPRPYYVPLLQRVLDSLRTASRTVTRLVATVVIDPAFESIAASALVAELVDFAAHCRLDYAASLVAESESVCPPSVGGECALGTYVREDRHEDFECFAAAVPHLVSMLIAPEGDPDALDIPTPRSYAEAIEGPYSSH
ncbi:unnamed protein product [Closterium sp. NIES-65]|nr:unnamed protein product [Closterium sp. NIES-65]